MLLVMIANFLRLVRLCIRCNIYGPSRKLLEKYICGPTYVIKCYYIDIPKTTMI